AQTADVPLRGQPVRSMGLPRTWHAHSAAMLGWERREDRSDRLNGVFLLGGYRDLFNPNYGALALSPELYVRAGEETDGG
ncbi:MAG: hypothetical protein GWO40_15630, partial [Gammaproteobacteria bacterium]|nr:hypothetical protein [Gammaproteobacteria bacterium]NIV52826.1 hypothetical protein [Gammaproteobacteria bacterium]NIX86963.1 hypothetical protein [Gammaproteobacteria bacterium]